MFQELCKGHLSVKSPDLKIETWVPSTLSPLKVGDMDLYLVDHGELLSSSSRGSVSFAVQRYMADWQCHLVREGRRDPAIEGCTSTYIVLLFCGFL